DQIGSGSLHGCIDGDPLGGRTTRPLGTAQFGQPDAPPKNRLDITLIGRLGAYGFHITRHTWIACEVTVDICPGRVPRNAEVGRQPELAHAVNQAEVDRLRRTTLLGTHLFERD